MTKRTCSVRVQIDIAWVTETTVTRQVPSSGVVTETAGSSVEDASEARGRAELAG